MDIPDAVIIDPSSLSPAATTSADATDERNTSFGSGGRLFVPSLAPNSAQPPPPPAKRLYRVAGNQWVTRDIAALDFLLNIPLQAESAIVQNGYLQQTKQQEEYEDSSSENSDHHHRHGTARRQSRRTAPQHQLHNRQQQYSAGTPGDPQGKWWEKWISAGLLAAVNGSNTGSSHHNTDAMEHVVLEGPTRRDKLQPSSMLSAYTPGRRLEGDDAIRIQIPLTAGGTTLTKQRSIARLAALREWERQTAHGIRFNTTATSSNLPTKTISGGIGATSTPLARSVAVIPTVPSRDHQPPLLDGRMFFSASGSYPVSVFSMIRYEPKREEAQLRRQKLEARGGGGSHFSIPPRGDWRGISYRSLLPRREHKDHEKQHRAFNRFVLRKDGEKDDSEEDDYDDDDTSMSSEDSNTYVPGILDDPDMVLGRHRNVMVGDRVIGPIIASTIQFVEPALLKADLNKQFRERFDGWEPSKSALKYIGARVVNGNYVLMDPVQEEEEEEEQEPHHPKTRKRQSSTASSISSEPTAADNHTEKQTTEKQIRMPPSLTLSKIRSLKHQALQVAAKANIEIGTLSLACVYFERLCLDCRVDKSNRRLTFAACLLLASKLNEPNVSLVMQKPKVAADGEGKASRFTSLVRPNTRGNTMFASLLEFFTQEWEIGLKQLFDAEWGVFAALGFDLHAQPSQVAFHFKRFMKTLEWSPKTYLGAEMYGYWQESLDQEDDHRRAVERRKARLKHRKEEELLNLHIEIEHDLIRRKNKVGSDHSSIDDGHGGGDQQAGDNSKQSDGKDPLSSNKVARKTSGINFFQRFGMRRNMSADTLFSPQTAAEYSHVHSLPLHQSVSTAADRTTPYQGTAQSTTMSHRTLPPTGAPPSAPATAAAHYNNAVAGLSDSAEAAMGLPIDVESGLLETYSIDSVNGSDRAK